jgi:hypothetical protein
MIIKIFIKNIKYFNKKTMRAEDGIKKYINKYLKNKINQTLKTKTLTKYIQTDMDRTTSLKLITKQNNLKSQTFSTLRVKTQWPSFLNSCMKPFWRLLLGTQIWISHLQLINSHQLLIKENKKKMPAEYLCAL